MPMGKVIAQLILFITLIWSVLKPWDSILQKSSFQWHDTVPYVTAVLAVYRTLMRTPLSWSVLTLVVRPHPSFDHCSKLPPAMLAGFRSAALPLLPQNSQTPLYYLPETPSALIETYADSTAIWRHIDSTTMSLRYCIISYQITPYPANSVTYPLFLFPPSRCVVVYLQIYIKRNLS